MIPPFRFFFDSADQARIQPGAASIQVGDDTVFVPPLVAPLYPSMVVSFQLKQPGRGPILRLIAPGFVTFHAEPGSPAPPGAASDGSLAPAAYAAWPTRGMLCLRIAEEQVLDQLRRIAGLEVTPSRFWYGPVVVPEPFLVNALPALEPRRVVRPPLAAVPTSAGGWLGNAIAAFLAGKYSVRFRLENEGRDDRSRDDLPFVPVDANQRGTLRVMAAASPKTYDCDATALDALSSTMDEFDPAHPRNGCIPPRHVYRRCRGAADDAMWHSNPSDGVAAVVMAEPPADATAPVYMPIRFTRIFVAEEDASIYFPRRTVEIAHAGFNEPFVSRLPVHGVLYVPMLAAQLANTRQVTIRIVNPAVDPEGELRIVEGNAGVWKTPATTDTLTLSLPAIGALHVVARRRFRFEVLRERRHTVGGASCTYVSLRRVVRALVDHRISGGRLNHGCATTSATTRSLLTRALGTLVNNIAADQPKTGSAIDTKEEIAEQALRLVPVLRAFFDDAALIHYYLWQSGTAKFAAEPASYPLNLIGGGGAAAAISMGLADVYAFAQPAAGLTVDQYAEQIHDLLVSGVVEPGAAMQLWFDRAGYTAIKNRDPVKPDGHSPIFLRVSGPGEAQGIWVIDQGGETFCPTVQVNGRNRIQWDGYPAPDVWLAANWKE